MGWFLWGITLGWAACAIYWYSQVSDVDRPANGAIVIFLLLGFCAVVVSVGLGVTSGAIPAGTPTPTSLGR